MQLRMHTFLLFKFLRKPDKRKQPVEKTAFLLTAEVWLVKNQRPVIGLSEDYVK